MQPGVIEWSELTSQSKIYSGDLLLIIFWTHPMFSGVYGEIDHILNGTDHRALKKAHGIGAARDRDRRRKGFGPHGIGAAPDQGIVAHHGRPCPQFPIGFVNPHDQGSTFSDI
jgi:hypothetical protein